VVIFAQSVVGDNTENQAFCGTSSSASRDNTVKFMFKLAQTRDPCADGAKLICGQFVRARARLRRLVGKFKQVSNRGLIEAQFARVTDERQAVEIGLAVPALASGTAMRVPKQALRFEIPDCGQFHPAQAGHLADSEHFPCLYSYWRD
jgi:hypothetical protein